MKTAYVVLLWLLAANALGPDVSTVTPTSGRGCIYILGRCIGKCPVGTHAYATGCGMAVSQPTCDEPKSRDIGVICDLSRCDCDEPNVKDTVNNKCVPESECPKKNIKTDKEMKTPYTSISP